MFTGDLTATAAAGHGGGYVGRALSGWLLTGLGGAGAVILLVTWWLIVIALVFGVTVQDAVAAILNLTGRAQAVPRAPAAGLPPNTTPVRPPAEPLHRPPTRQTPAPLRSAAPPSGAPPAAPMPAPVVHQPLYAAGGQTWKLPTIGELLDPGTEQDISAGILRQQARIIEETLESLGAPVWVRETNPGPVVTQFGVEPRVFNAKCLACKQVFFMAGGKAKCPACGSENVVETEETKVKVSRIKALADDLALALEAKTLRVEAPIPGKGLIGIEVPNPEIALVALRDVMESERYEALDSPLKLCLGQDVSGQPAVADLTAMPHLLIAGTTGSGKSVCINAIIAALLFQRTPDELKFLMVDPKRVELIGYEGIPHLLAKDVVLIERVTSALQWVLLEMDGRYRRFGE